MITWGSKTGCGQQRDISSNPLHSNPESELEPQEESSGVFKAHVREGEIKVHKSEKSQVSGAEIFPDSPS